MVRRVSDKKGHAYKMCVGSGVFDSINEIIKPIIDFTFNNKDTIKHVGQNTRLIVITLKKITVNLTICHRVRN